MKPVYSNRQHTVDIDRIMSVCGAIPRGDELPQVASENDILADIYSDALGVPHEYAAGMVHRQYIDEDYNFDEIVH